MSLDDDLNELFSKYSRQEIISKLERRKEPQSLAIISDGGMHMSPLEAEVCEKYVFSEGMINVDSDETLRQHILSCCVNLAEKLRSRQWNEISLFYSGHALLAAYAKLTVYRVTHLDTVDFGYFGSHGFRRIYLPIRENILTK